MVQPTDPDDDADIDVPGEPDAADDSNAQPTYWNPYIAVAQLPTEHGKVSHVHVGSLYLGSVVSHKDHHLAVTHDGQISEHESSEEGVDALLAQHGMLA